MRTVLKMLFLVCILTACSSEQKHLSSLTPPTETEVNYAEAYGWHIQDTIGDGMYNVQQLYPERIEMMKNNGVDVTACSSGEIHTRSFSVVEKQQDGGAVSINILYCNDEIIGGTGGLENWSPGSFAIGDKQRLIDAGTIAE